MFPSTTTARQDNTIDVNDAFLALLGRPTRTDARRLAAADVFCEKTLSAVVATQALPVQQREFLTLKSHGMQCSWAPEIDNQLVVSHLNCAIYSDGTQVTAWATISQVSDGQESDTVLIRLEAGPQVPGWLQSSTEAFVLIDDQARIYWINAVRVPRGKLRVSSSA